MRRIIWTVAAVIGATAAPLSAQAPVNELLVSVDWLAQHINDPGLVLLHVGDPALYDQEHIPGARLIALTDLSTPREDGGLALELPDPAVLRSRLEKLGISDDSRIVVYAGQDWFSPATRVLFTLDYLGLGERSSLLNGGMGEWKRAGRTVTAAVPAVQPGSLSARPVKGVVVDAAFVERLPQRTVLVDGRGRVFYDGTEEANGVRGHIVHARSIPFNSVADDRLLIDVDALRALFSAAGIAPGDTVVAYCHIGQQATAVVFAARLLGREARLYDGSMQDWAQRGLPVTRDTSRP